MKKWDNLLTVCAPQVPKMCTKLKFICSICLSFQMGFIFKLKGVFLHWPLLDTIIVGNVIFQDDSVILSSQSGEDVFNENAWQTLLNDLGEDGQKVMIKFSIATSLQKVR